MDLREHLLADNGIVGLEIVEPGDVERAVRWFDRGSRRSTGRRERIPNSTVEYWTNGDQPFGRYPHLVDPDRFVARLDAFWR